MVGRDELATARSDTLNAVGATLAKLCPALLAGVPWGIQSNGSPSPPPNSALLHAFTLVMQWESPALAAHLVRGEGYAMGVMRLLLSHLAAVASPPAATRLMELALWDTIPHPPPKCHVALLLVSLLRQSEAVLLATPVHALGAALTEQLSVPSVLAADRLHAAARALALTTPASLKRALDDAWSAKRQAQPTYACATLDGDEISPESSLGRFWVVDLRDTTAFEASHYALTLHLPPERATSPDEREAARSQLFALCAEGAVGIAVLTAADPTAASGGRGVLSADETKRVVGEFVQAGFRRVGIVAGGFAALTREQKVNLVSGGDAVTAPDGADGMMEVRGRSTSKAAAAVGRMGMAAMKRVSGALPAQMRGRAKQAPI